MYSPLISVMDMDIVSDLKMKDQGEVISNGTNCNGQKLDSKLPSNSLKDKLKGSMDGFGIVSRNGKIDQDLSENGNGMETNAVNGDEATNDSEGQSISVDDDQHDSLSLIEEYNNEDNKVMSVVDDSKDVSMDEDSKAVSIDEDSNAASEGTGSSHKMAVSREESMDVDEADLTDDKTNDSNAVVPENVKPSNENTKERTVSSGLSNDGDNVSISNEDASSKKHDEHAEGDSIKSDAKKEDSKFISEGREESSPVVPQDDDRETTEAVVIGDSPTKALKKSVKPSKVDRLLANEKSQGSSSSGSENLRPFARLLFDLGLDLTRQQVYKDLIRVQSKKRSHNKLNDKEEKQLDKLKDAYAHLIDKNKCFSGTFHKCSKCNYKTDSVNAMAYHKEFDHKGSCSLCDFVTGNASAFYFHMEAEHNRQGRVEPVLGMFVCPHCPYEHHSARKNFIKHLAKCEKAFDLKRNLQPMPADCDIPLKPAPVSVQVTPHAGRGVRQPPPLVKKPQVPVNPVAQTARNMVPSALGAMRPTSIAGQTIVQPGLPQWLNVQDNQGPQLVQMGGQYFLVVTQNGQTFMTPMTSGAVPSAVQAGVPGAVPKVMPVQQAVPPSKSVTKPSAPEPKSALKQSPKGTFEICEICGGFVKDRDSLRIHFFWAHKIEIHPSLMKAREPALNCNNASCQRRFWTYQGYQRHVTVAHGGEVSKAPSPGMTCYVCGISTVDFITHMTAKHPQVVKHMLSQMRCVVCQDALPTETALESHMFIEHKDVVTKYGSLVGGMSKNNTKKAPEKAAAVPTGAPVPNEFQKQVEIDCSRCDLKFSSTQAYGTHFSKEHVEDKEQCDVCKEDIQVGNPFIQHVEEKHLKDLSIPVKRLSRETIASAKVSRKRRSSDDIIVIDLDEKKRQKMDSMSEDGDENDVTEKDMSEEKDLFKKNDVQVKDVGNDPEKASDDGIKEANKKVIEEIIEVDGEKVVIQKMIE